jgi:hypothetical protein
MGHYKGFKGGGKVCWAVGSSSSAAAVAKEASQSESYAGGDSWSLLLLVNQSMDRKGSACGTSETAVVVGQLAAAKQRTGSSSTDDCHGFFLCQNSRRKWEVNEKKIKKC